MSEADIKMILDLDKYAVIYKDENGKTIPFSVFAEFVSAGKSFKDLKRPETLTAEISIIAESSATVAPGNNKKSGVLIANGGLMPALKYRDLNGSQHKLSNNNSRYTLLSFYFSECAPCIKEIPELNTYATKHKDINVLAITFDPKSNAEIFVAKYGLKWPTIANAQSFIDVLGISAYPTLVLVSPEGRLVATKIGGIISSTNKNAGLEALEQWVQDNKIKN